MLKVLLLEVGCVLAEVITLEILAALDLLIVLFLLLQLLFKSHLLCLQALDLLYLLVLLLLGCLGLATVDGKLVIGLFWLDFAFESLALAR